MVESSKKYYLFGLALLLFQIIGYNIISLSILIIAIIPIISANELLANIKTVPLYFYFLIFSLVIGFYFTVSNGITKWNIEYWGQFYFLSFILLAVKDKQQALTIIKYCVYIIFIADLFSNLLLLAGFDIPWSTLPPVRKGETIARFTGVKGNTLYSGSITFIALCFMFQESLKSKIKKYFCIFCMIFNLTLSGSYRYFIICAVVATLYYFHLYKHRIILFITYISSILIVYFSTELTMFISASNFSRFLIWKHFFGEISKCPFFGHGFFNIHLEDIQDFSFTHLIASGVTESCILLLAYCFGIPILLLYLSNIFTTLKRYCYYSEYKTELGLFIGLTLDLFWGGSFDNSISFSALTLSLYIINQIGYKKQYQFMNESPNEH